jgi:diaminopropionate ammonia-lyase
MGVGAFMAAAVTHYRSGEQRPVIVGVEPLDANCVQASALAGEIAHVPGPHRSIMVGLNCGRPSLTAWPRLASGIDWLVSVDDDAARRAMCDLADAAVAAGETGAAALAGLVELLGDADARAELGDLTRSTVLLVVTEGATDPDNFEAIVGRSPETVGRVLTALR